MEIIWKYAGNQRAKKVTNIKKQQTVVHLIYCNDYLLNYFILKYIYFL